ncbi:hypothetical protein PR048_005958 [Dryococelus australis]|uniref:Endonuclease/exonuclease/phosphatase domain-containing protein n=1 Tax=Dryococelus australis TaxID=614101 RepID=A0ABQ9I9N3_9NEOP|nr:hypothetical protein PR048_005958 [Dryococelus australis]
MAAEYVNWWDITKETPKTTGPWMDQKRQLTTLLNRDVPKSFMLWAIARMLRWIKSIWILVQGVDKDVVVYFVKETINRRQSSSEEVPVEPGSSRTLELREEAAAINKSIEFDPVLAKKLMISWKTWYGARGSAISPIIVKVWVCAIVENSTTAIKVKNVPLRERKRINVLTVRQKARSPITGFIGENALHTRISAKRGNEEVYLTSLYFQFSDPPEDHLTQWELNFHKLRGRKLLIVADANTKSEAWHSPVTDEKGTTIHQFIVANGLTVNSREGQSTTNLFACNRHKILHKCHTGIYEHGRHDTRLESHAGLLNRTLLDEFGDTFPLQDLHGRAEMLTNVIQRTCDHTLKKVAGTFFIHKWWDQDLEQERRDLWKCRKKMKTERLPERKEAMGEKHRQKQTSVVKGKIFNGVSEACQEECLANLVDLLLPSDSQDSETEMHTRKQSNGRASKD